MAKRSKSGLKRKRQSVKRAARNQSVRSMIKTLVKQARQASGNAAPEVLAAIRALDSAARKGIMHPNAVARSKSRLIRQVNRERAAATA